MRTHHVKRDTSIGRMVDLARHSTLIWVTATGKRIPITQMGTTHLFNAMKMVFNHLAETYGGEPVWFQHKYTDVAREAVRAGNKLACAVVMMLRELDTRDDLPPHYVLPLELMRAQLPKSQRRLKDGDSN